MLILKNASILTLIPDADFARYSVCISEGKIADVIRHNESNQESISKKYERWLLQAGNAVEQIDCTDKVILPALFNSCLKSESALIKYLLRKRQYEISQTDLCTDFIFNYIYQELPSEETKKDLQTIYKYSLTRNLKCGVAALNEITPRKDTNHLQPFADAAALSGQNVRLCYPMKEEIYEHGKCKYSYYLTDENQLTIYDISNLGELKDESIEYLFLEVATNKEVTEKFNQTYNKPVIVLLDEYGLIDNKTSLINPLYLTYDEIKILSERESSVIICPSDLIYFSNRYFPLDDFLNHNIKFRLATGWLGEDLFHEIRIFRNRYKELNISSAEYLRAVTRNGVFPKGLLEAGEQSEKSETSILDFGSQASFIFLDTSDIRFQFLPEDADAEKVCDFLVDNLTPYSISDVMIDGKFRVRNHKFNLASSVTSGLRANTDLEHEILLQAAETRERLYKAGKYQELKKRNEERRDIEQLDLRSRDEEEIRLFSDTAAAGLSPASDAAAGLQENAAAGLLSALADDADTFKIKRKLTIFKKRTSRTQRNLFEEPEITQLPDSAEYKESPEFNLLYSELEESRHIQEELMQAKITEAELLKRSTQKKTTPPSPEEGKKIELPKDVKLKFGDD